MSVTKNFLNGDIKIEISTATANALALVLGTVVDLTKAEGLDQLFDNLHVAGIKGEGFDIDVEENTDYGIGDEGEEKFLVVVRDHRRGLKVTP